MVIVAAGRGERAGVAEGPKQYRSLGGRSVLAHTIESFRSHTRDRPHRDGHPRGRSCLLRGRPGRNPGVSTVAGGGTPAGIRPGAHSTPSTVTCPGRCLIHDAVRPFVDRDLLDRVIAGVTHETGAVPALPVSGHVETSRRRRADRGDSAARRPARRPDASGLPVCRHSSCP